jgi:murein DD-endopeptidase MepM/ murein hydrolase activator NlpD
MTSSASRHRGDWRRDLRTFGAGAGCGFLAGALLVGGLLWRYHFIQWPTEMSRAAREDDVAPVLEPAESRPTATVGRRSPTAPASARSVIGPDASSPAELKDRDLRIPVDGVKPEQLTRQFSDTRGASRQHEALDILAAYGTPVRAVENGTVARLFVSKAGGNTIYQFDPTATFCYYYAHLDRYADGLREGMQIQKGQVIGYVGTSGNAPKNAPHLHFAIFRLTEAKHWWEGTPIDPYDVLR